MRQFEDADGRAWEAEVQEYEGVDYKGRYHLVMRSGDSVVSLHDVRWNSERSARRTLETMSPVELRRRLRSAVGRSPAAAAS